ncbi:hypothetical protein EW145_g6855 [Phellinidium pouzarii]|uniref:Uncharacterized protein n=1 Tax=Phellinidium pouzarii TaxID=167371 RepID=A0A4S4KTJ3_9AGAM|nr:hypothetical protein EW145_g6855 [Phellinidium pouzarii]
MLNASQYRLRTPSNRDFSSVSRYSRRNTGNTSIDSPLQAKSFYPQSTSRVFIKPKEKPKEKLSRRSSSAFVPLSAQQRSARSSLPKSTSSANALPRGTVPRSSSSFLAPAVTNVTNVPRKRLPRSSTSLRPDAIHEADSDSAFFAQSFTSENRKLENLQPATRVRTQRRASVSKYKYKENTSPVHLRATDRSSHTFARKQSPLVPKDRRTSQRLSRTFLVPKVEEHVSKPQPLLPRRTSICYVVPRHEKRPSLTDKENALSSLPTQVLKHTPKSTSGEPFRLLVSGENRLHTSSATSLAAVMPSLPTQALKHTPRSSSLAPHTRAPSYSSSTNDALGTLPTQILKHTPYMSCTGPQTTAADSPCLSKARTKTIWTMSDEITLVRAGGVLPDAYALEPSSHARIVPLCQRLRNGVSESGSAQGLVPAMKDVRTPVRSASTPYHLLASSARRTNSTRASSGEGPALPPVPSLSRALAHVEDTDNGEESAEADRKVERYNWTFINIKKPENRVASMSDRFLEHGPGGYGVCVGAKPSLLTRAHTLMKLKITGPRVLTSKKLVGRGDSRF